MVLCGRNKAGQRKAIGAKSKEPLYAYKEPFGCEKLFRSRNGAKSARDDYINEYVNAGGQENKKQLRANYPVYRAGFLVED